ncbi:MAG: hypothetical protein DCC67_14890 [Planctomycetota bacterium]|nr:MAG: hypothetical protein DCC67_14890 [Planctomycetota bacterium]
MSDPSLESSAASPSRRDFMKGASALVAGGALLGVNAQVVRSAHIAGDDEINTAPPPRRWRPKAASSCGPSATPSPTTCSIVSKASRTRSPSIAETRTRSTTRAASTFPASGSSWASTATRASSTAASTSCCYARRPTSVPSTSRPR